MSGDGYTEIVDWLLTLPKNATVFWAADDFLTDDIDFVDNWVDVRVPSVDLGLSWLWTIEDLHHPEPGMEDTCVIRIAPKSPDGWSKAEISTALANWVAEHARRYDISFAWDPDATLSPQLKEVLDELQKSSLEDNYMLTEGIMATSTVMDQLLAMDGDTAAALVNSIKETIGDRTDGTSIVGKPINKSYRPKSS